jgi:hypothetical protein
MTGSDTALKRMTRNTAGLPTSAQALQPKWDRMLEDLVPVLSNAVDRPLRAGTVGLSISDTLQFRRDRPLPGLIIPIRVAGAEGYMALVDEATARVVSCGLLRALSAAGTEAVPLSVLDMLLVRNFLTDMLSVIGETFEIPLAVNRDEEPFTEWPFSLATRTEPVMVAQITLETESGEALRVELTLPPDAPAFHQQDEPAPAPTATAIGHARTTRIHLEAILDSWTVRASELGTLGVGSVLPLPGATLEALQLVARTARGPVPLARGEHGRTKASQALRITAVEPLG